MCIYDTMGDPNTTNDIIQLSAKLPCKIAYTLIGAVKLRNFANFATSSHWRKLIQM